MSCFEDHCGELEPSRADIRRDGQAGPAVSQWQGWHIQTDIHSVTYAPAGKLVSNQPACIFLGKKAGKPKQTQTDNLHTERPPSWPHPAARRRRSTTAPLHRAAPSEEHVSILLTHQRSVLWQFNTPSIFIFSLYYLCFPVVYISDLINIDVCIFVLTVWSKSFFVWIKHWYLMGG